MKRTERTELTVSKIQEAALEEFGVNGYAGGTINNICKRGINKGLIYHNFKNKDELFLVCLKNSCKKLVSLIEESGPALNQLQYMKLRMRFFTEYPNEAHIFFEAVLQPQEKLRDRIKQMLVWKELKSYGKGLIVTTLTQSLGTFFFVTLVFAIVLWLADVPVYLAFLFGGIALATAPAPALSIVNEFHAKGPVTNTLLPMAVLDDIVAIIVFFSVNSIVASSVSGGSVPLYMIPVMVLLPVVIGLVTGLPAGWLLNRVRGRVQTLAVLLAGITLTAIVDLGAPLNYHLILGAGFYTFLYIAARGAGKYFGARFGAKAMKMPETVQKYLGLTLLPHSGVSLVFTGIACATLASQPELVGILLGTIAAAAVINEIIAVIAAKKGFELAEEIERT